MSISIKECKEALGNVAEKMTDPEIEDLNNLFMALSDIAIDASLERIKKNEITKKA